MSDINLSYKIRYMIDNSNIERFHTLNGIPKQNLGNHQWRVTLIYLMIYKELKQRPNLQLLIETITHDKEENITGDVPRKINDNDNLLNSIHTPICIQHLLCNDENTTITSDVLKLHNYILTFADDMELFITIFEEWFFKNNKLVTSAYELIYNKIDNFVNSVTDDKQINLVLKLMKDFFTSYLESNPNKEYLKSVTEYSNL